MPGKRIHLADIKRVSVRVLFEHAGERSIGVRFSSERVICHCQGRLPPFVCRLLLSFEQRAVAVTALEQYEAKVKVPQAKVGRIFSNGRIAATASGRWPRRI